jgi:hypothetical protein
VSMTTKSATFKKPKPCEPANKAKSSVLSTVEGPRAANPLVSQTLTNDRCSSILGCHSTATVIPARAETTSQHLASGNYMADSSSLSTVHGQKNFRGKIHFLPSCPLHVFLLLFAWGRSSVLLNANVSVFNSSSCPFRKH